MSKTIKELYADTMTNGLFYGTGLSSETYMQKYLNNHSFFDKIFVQKYGHRVYEGINSNILQNWNETVQAYIVMNGENFLKMWDALRQDYEPLNNYDKTSTITTKYKGTETNTSSASGSNTNGESTITSTGQVSPENLESDFVNTSKDVTVSAEVTNTTSASGNNTKSFTDREDEVSERTFGNIGVTRSQEMLMDEVNLRLTTEFYTKIFTQIIFEFTW